MRSGVPVVRCKAFDYNLGALERAQLPKMRPRTWNINVKYQQFCESVAKGRIKVEHVFTHNRLGDALTKNLPKIFS